MWARVLTIGLCAIFASGTLTKGKEQTATELNIGEKLHTGIHMFILSDNYTCYLETPQNKTISFGNDEVWDKSKYEFTANNVYGCLVTVNITSAADSGYWRLYYILEKTGKQEGTVTYNITVNDQNDKEVEPSAEDRNVQIFDSHFFNSRIGVEHTVTIVNVYSIKTEACYIITPNGKLYHKPEVPKRSSVAWVEESHLACGVKIKVESDDMVGNWTLFTRDVKDSKPFERRQPFRINVEEIVNDFQQTLLVEVGDNLSFRPLNQTGKIHALCKLVGPDGKPFQYEESSDTDEKCSFVVRNASLSHAGRWHIVYGQNIIYKVPIDVKVYETEPRPTEMVWREGLPVNVDIGPEDAIYCRVITPIGDVASDGFGRCHINIERVSQQHSGTWRFIISTPGNIRTRKLQVHVTVKRFNPTYKVKTTVESHYNGLTYFNLTCKAPGVIRSCHFRQPNGEMLFAPPGEVKDFRRSIYYNFTTLNTVVSEDSCSLRITKPDIRRPDDPDVGLWRCVIQIENDTAVYSNVMEVMPIYGPPALQAKADNAVVERYEGDAVIMSCSFPAAIDYCHFRAPNGTVYNVNPGTKQEGYEYFGSSLFLGECGVKFNKIFVQDSGTWTCHAGLLENESSPEQYSEIELRISKLFQVIQIKNGSSVIVGVIIDESQSYTSCRFVMADGIGFTTRNIPTDGYEPVYYIENKRGCGIRIDEPNELELRPWTVVLRLSGGKEVWGTTDGLLQQNSRYDIIAWLWSILIWLGIATFLLFIIKQVAILCFIKKESPVSNENQVNQFEKPTYYVSGNGYKI